MLTETLAIRNTIEKFSAIIPGLWFSIEEEESSDLPEIATGDLVEWTRYEDEDEIGIGIIKAFSNQKFFDYETSEYVYLQCAYVVNANPNDTYGYYIPLSHLDFISLSEYMSIYKDEYEANLQDLQVLRRAVTSQMQVYGWERGQGDLSQLFHITDIIQSEAIQ